MGVGGTSSGRKAINSTSMGGLLEGKLGFFFNNSLRRDMLCERCGMLGCIKFNKPKNDCSCNTLEERYFCDSLYLLRVRFHAFPAENGAVIGDLGALYVTLPADKN